MTNPIIAAADTPKPAPAVTPAIPQPDKGAPSTKPEEKSTSGK